ncbi:proline dehydrogenase family protein [Actinocorallia populi]|uniref:proline dehydrogenase family protein n=1 Tax=Actinocorallia populi TaxID=2079200 RepID=UPI000D09087B|nr:proline dehydrogenase family protein [Actinocorallia populi]
MLRRSLLAASRSPGLRTTLVTAPVTRRVVRRFVAGEDSAQALEAAARLLGDGLLVSLDRLGEDVRDPAGAETTVRAYEKLLPELPEGVEVSVKLTALGQALDEDLALANARRVCAAAARAGTTVTLDMEDHTTVGSTLRVLDALRREHPWTGAVVQAQLRRAEEYCASLAYEGSRVRLCKGAYDPPPSAGYTAKAEVDKSYVRCLRTLMAGRGYPMVATHDPRLIEIADALRMVNGRDLDSFEYQMLYGIRPDEQLRLARTGARVRVYVPYGEDWYGYLVRRLAERPANLAFFLRSLRTRS